MSKRQSIIFLAILSLIGLSSLLYSSRVLADLMTSYPLPEEKAKIKLVLSPDSTVSLMDVTLEENLVDARWVVNRRLSYLNLSDAFHVANQEGRLAVTLPESENTPYIVSIITHLGEIEFINGGAESPPIGLQVETGLQAKPDQNIYQTLFTSREIQELVPPNAAAGQLFYQLTLEPAAAQNFINFVETQPGYYVCMVMDKQVLNCSVMYHLSGNTIDILPNLSSGSAVSLADLAIFLDSGPLPMPLNVQNSFLP